MTVQKYHFYLVRRELADAHSEATDAAAAAAAELRAAKKKHEVAAQVRHKNFRSCSIMRNPHDEIGPACVTG